MQNLSKRVIFDSNIWVSFGIGKRLNELKIALTHPRIEVFVCQKLLWEVKVVVQKPKLLKYISQDRQKLLLELMQACQCVNIVKQTSKPIEIILKKKEVIPKIIERAFKGNPLSEEQKENNRIKSRTRCRVEHVFGFITNNMNDFYIQSIGFQHAKGVIGLINLVYNMCRYEQIIRLKLLPIKK